MSSSQAPSTSLPETVREIRSTVSPAGFITVAIGTAPLNQPGPDEVVIRVEASPINPSDLGLLIANGDVSAAEAIDVDGHPAMRLPIPTALSALSARFDLAMPVGNEGGGVVVAAGSSDAAQALLGSTVGFVSGNAYAEYRTVHALSCVAMPDGTSPVDAAASFVNPLTVLGMVETMRSEGHTALVHTVGASNLGQMLNRVCLNDGIGLVNIVRKDLHVEMLREQGAEHVVNSSSESFRDDLREALRATGATIAFDAIGGGDLANDLLTAMESVASEGQTFSRYGSSTNKQVYIYGGLDRGPTTLTRSFGLSWSLGGWLLTPFLAKIGPEAVGRLQQRVADEITSTFASTYGTHLSLDAVVDPEQARRYARMASGDKALITPHA